VDPGEAILANGSILKSTILMLETLSHVAARSNAATFAVLRALRPRHWLKNGVLLAGILFTLQRGHPLSDWLRVGAAILVFSVLASAIYLVNDVCDVEQDRLHPKKRRRPIAAGEVSIPFAIGLAVCLALAGAVGSLALGWPFAGVALTYLLLTVVYSLRLKHIVLIDVMALSACYVVRAAAGAVVIDVDISAWLMVCTTLGALLLGLAKRRNELIILERAGEHRPILEEYSVQLLDQLISIVAGTTLTAYMLYTFFSPTAQQRPLMMLTIPPVLYGLFRFLYLIHRRGVGGNPALELVEDPPLLWCALFWALACGAIILLTH
jgi:4-hydroxybenzoate polyprenyltransferase